jgi:hypothetical protein
MKYDLKSDLLLLIELVFWDEMIKLNESKLQPGSKKDMIKQNDVPLLQ